MAKGKVRAKKASKGSEIECEDRKEDGTLIELRNTCGEKLDLNNKSASSGVAKSPKKGGKSPRAEDELNLEQQAERLSEILGVNNARKLEWPEEQKQPANAWEKFDVKKLRNVGVPLDFVPPEELEGIKIAMVQQKDVQLEMEYWQSSYKAMDSYYRKLWKDLGVDKVSHCQYLGKPIATDSLTASKDKAAYARVLEEVEIQEHPPLTAHFVDETGKLIE
ncbi:OLC1v1018719C1 [Oldenlandia corymbosa var. corymbosa]|uniref:OLC1v1018719C1 n=1 Tax=Oldenlandia corymbosa var. corymbosa TaxID=529605 RepID=A0AAV1ECB6_OLDCO|nr:OLC1v1018719C1 [Oldenlandia corymbosa var. corymbosa]